LPGEISVQKAKEFPLSRKGAKGRSIAANMKENRWGHLKSRNAINWGNPRDIRERRQGERAPRGVRAGEEAATLVKKTTTTEEG